MHNSTALLLRFFAYGHLSDELQNVSRPFASLAASMTASVEDGGMGLAGPELTAGLRKLLESKDCAVRAAL